MAGGELLRRFYSRAGLAYIVPLFLFTAVVSVGDVSSFTFIGMRYISFDPALTKHVLVVALTGSTTALGLTFVVTFVLLRPFIQWMTGRKDTVHAPRAWENGVRGVPRLVYLGTALIVLSDMPAMVIATRTTGLTSVSVFIFMAIVAATIAGGAIVLSASEIWIRPVIEEIGASLPIDFEPTIRQRRIILRLVAFIVLVSFLSPFYTNGVIAPSATPSTRVITTVAASAVIALTFGLAFSLAAGRMVSAPVGDLLRATRAVRSGDLTTRVLGTSDDEIGELSRSFNAMVGGLAEREALHSALGTYVDPVVADRLLSEGEVLEGEEVDATIMFVDIVGFTARSEAMQPRAVVDDLNAFFQLILPVVNAHGGHTNKLLGDGFMAVFGAPIVMDDHADRALTAALEIQERMRQRYGTGLRVGVGLNSGPVVVGTTGGGSKLDFTVIGDAVNVASRIEAMTRSTGDDILLTETTRAALRTEVALAHRGSSPVRGRAEPVSFYSPVSRISG